MTEAAADTVGGAVAATCSWTSATGRGTRQWRTRPGSRSSSTSATGRRTTWRSSTRRARGGAGARAASSRPPSRRSSWARRDGELRRALGAGAAPRHLHRRRDAAQRAYPVELRRGFRSSKAVGARPSALGRQSTSAHRRGTKGAATGTVAAPSTFRRVRPTGAATRAILPAPQPGPSWPVRHPAFRRRRGRPRVARPARRRAQRAHGADRPPDRRPARDRRTTCWPRPAGAPRCRVGVPGLARRSSSRRWPRRSSLSFSRASSRRT